MSEPATMHIDGAARGNPGPAAYAVVIARPGQPPIEESDTLGKTTNNVAEYTALVAGLERAAELGLKRLDVFSDSELLVKQMNGEYRVKSPDLQDLYAEAKALRAKFDRVTLTHVRREQNADADRLCNVVLDGEKKRKKAAAAASGWRSAARWRRKRSTRRAGTTATSPRRRTSCCAPRGWLRSSCAG